MKLTDAIAKQEKALELLKKTNTNMRKKGLRRDNIESYLKGLETRWDEIRALDEEIEKTKSADNANMPYYSGWMEEAEEPFLEQRGLLLEALYECEGAANPPPAQRNATTSSTRSSYRKLPHMDLPKFSGDYTQWASFKDLFLSMVRDGDLTEVDRLQYLRASLSGEAALLIKNIQVTAENYARAWKKLEDQYENKGLIVNSCLNSLFQMPPLIKESGEGLKTLIGTTNDIIEVLTALKRPVTQWDDILIYLTVQRLDPKSRRDWETTVADTTEPSTFVELKSFMESRIRALKAIEHGGDSLLKTTSSNAPSITHWVKLKQQHTSVRQMLIISRSRRRFKALEVKARKEFATNNRLCYNCLGFHGVKDCRSKKTCYHCRGKHHSLLHLGISNSSSTGPAQRVESHATLTQTPEEMSASEPTQDNAQAHTTRTNATLNLALMAIAQVRVLANGRKILVRALLDPCSDTTFIREPIVQLLRLSKQPVCISVGGVGGGISHTARSQVAVNIAPRFQSETAWSVKALVLSKLTDYLPPRYCLPTDLEFLEGLTLADPHYAEEETVDMILGLDVYTQIIRSGLRKNSNSHLIAQETAVGWILSGKIIDSISNEVNSHATVTNDELLQGLHRFSEQEEIPCTKVSRRTPEELDCEQLYKATTRRTEEGRYMLRLPFNNKIEQLADSYDMAKKMLLRMEKKLDTNVELHQLYCEFIEEYIRLGHAAIVDPASLQGKRVFEPPHHVRIKGSGRDTKIRVVFNGSVRLNGPNLNNCLYSGPNLLKELRNIIQLWRLHRFVWTADTAKMFRQILIDPEDRNFLLILWRKSPGERIQIIRLNTVTYGLICSPFQALRTVEQLCQDEGGRFPRAKEVLEKTTYMDDSYGGGNSLIDVKLQREEFTQLLRAGGFPLGKWASNDPQLLEDIPLHQRASASLAIQESEKHSVLGLDWHPATDIFTYKIKWPLDESLAVTKRKVVAQTASLYDPLGWISPVIVKFKIFIQSLWHLGAQWDVEIPLQQAEKWRNLTRQLVDLSQVVIPRYIGSTERLTALELHGFADASEKAMAAVIYLRVLGQEANSTCNILISKTKVAPLKQISLPGLELNAAFMLANLVRHQVEALSLTSINKFLWSDSTVALSWIKGHPTRWNTYVANRVSSIQGAVPDASWSHVAGALNPADIASRGSTVTGLLSAEYWLSGPAFLRCTNSPWKADSNFVPLQKCPEERKIVHVITKNNIAEWEVLSRYSSWDKLLRVTARCQQFFDVLRLTIRRPSNTRDQYHGKTGSDFTVLEPKDIKKAEMAWLRYVQHLHFPEEMRTLLSGKKLNKNSKILKLNPFVDSEGLLRVGGCLKHSLLADEAKNQFILPIVSAMSKLLIRDTHLRTLHGGTQLVLSTLRQKFWITNGRTAVKAITSTCVTCWKQRPATMTQLMGDLPAPRVRPARPFLHTGVDFAGPVSLRMSKGRGVKTFKGYVVIFVCFATRAVHLEVASDYSSEEFIAVCKRFTGRRGICDTLYSDCGTNFVGADRQMRELFQQAGASDKAIAEALLKDRTTWKFNPAGAPHFGGLWEAGVKAVKYHLKRVVGECILNFEEMSTLLSQIEACLNSRPLQPMSDDPTDLSMLTPAHFLIGEPINTIPEPSVLEIPENRLSRWQLVRKMTEDFWKAWSLHYLQGLQKRTKWTLPQENIKVGDICKLRVESMAPCKWPLGRVIKVSTGPDGLVRVATIKTATTIRERPVAKLCVLPILDNNSSLHDEGGRNVQNSA